MRFLLSVIDTGTNTGSDEEMATIDAFNDSLRENGHWIFACGVDDPAKATVVDNRNNAGHVSEGPLNNLSEYLSGFWLIEASDVAEAVRLATEGSNACNRKVEVRPLLG